MNMLETVTAARDLLDRVYAPEGIALFRFECCTRVDRRPDCPWQLLFSFVRPSPSYNNVRTYVFAVLDDAGQCQAILSSESRAEALALFRADPGAVSPAAPSLASA